MSKQVNLKGLNRTKLTELIKAHDGELVVEGVTLTLRKEDKGIDLDYKSVQAFMLVHSDEMNEWYIHSSFNLGNALDVYKDCEHIARVFGVDLVTKEVEVAPEDTYKLNKIVEPEFDQRDVTIAKLEAQISVYKSMLPSTNKVTYERNEGF